MYKQVVELLEEAAISYKQYAHEPIVDYETDRKIRERFKCPITGLKKND
ncbi:hypothetical protein [Bacillus sp. JAS102]|nr:hypothetical protein [Bacillus sp. JAS102]MBJ3793584.1 hypothetical protein [Bacillus sp. OA1]